MLLFTDAGSATCEQIARSADLVNAQAGEVVILQAIGGPEFIPDPVRRTMGVRLARTHPGLNEPD